MEKPNKKLSLKKKVAYSSLGAIFSVLFSSHAFASAINTDNVLNLLNQERLERGLPKLVLDSDLDNAANLKSRDMVNRDYFEHFAFGSTPWDFIKNSGYKYLYAGENLAMDFNTSEGMVNAWMNSPAHRENILNPEFRDVGVGIIKGEFSDNKGNHNTIMVTNMFGRKKPTIVKIFDFITQNLFNNVI
ncbi:MAG: CAP domain-containing protein [Patescibacteria group bacterium]|nr:CAP domain-containing protein [Patescibacteria group bacterium]